MLNKIYFVKCKKTENSVDNMASMQYISQAAKTDGRMKAARRLLKERNKPPEGAEKSSEGMVLATESGC